MLKKHSVNIQGHSTSFSLEDEFYTELKRIAKRDQVSISSIITNIDTNRDPNQNLSSALRLLVLEDLKQSLKTQA